MSMAGPAEFQIKGVAGGVLDLQQHNMGNGLAAFMLVFILYDHLPFVSW